MDCEIEKNKVSKKASYEKAFKAAFPYTIPVMTGYLFIGMAFGVMIQEKGYNFLWAILMREWTVSRREFFCAGRESFTGNFHGVYVKYPAYFLWSVIIRAFCKDGEEASVYDLFPDR